MIRSIKHFLLFYLLLSITLTSSLTALGNYFLDNRVIKQHFASQLQQAANFLDALVSQNPNKAYLKELQQRISLLPIITEDQEFQVWNQRGQLLLHSQNAPIIPLKKIHMDFNTITINDHNWLVVDVKKATLSQHHIVVAARYDIHTRLKQQMTWVNLLMLLWSYPLLGLLIWFIVDRGLVTLQRLTYTLFSRNPTQLTEIDIENAPIEIKPLIDALNRLFLKLHKAFERNVRFSADAAHELRTPLAALKTQAQVALKAPNEELRKVGLKNVISGVDRCTHIVQQLLTLSRLDPENALHNPQYFDIAKLAMEIIAQLVPAAITKNIEIALHQPKNDSLIMYGSETAMSILIRNLVDNAIRYTPENGIVNVELFETKKDIVLRVNDTGPGIPKGLRKRVFERFYRVLGNQASGSGLGLAIVQQIAKLHHAKIILGEPKNTSGLEVEIQIPKKFRSFEN